MKNTHDAAVYPIVKHTSVLAQLFAVTVSDMDPVFAVIVIGYLVVCGIVIYVILKSRRT